MWWSAASNHGLSVDEVAKEIAGKKLPKDYEVLCSILGIRPHPGLVATEDCLAVRNHVLDLGTMKTLSVGLPASQITRLIFHNAAVPVDQLRAALTKRPLDVLQLDYNGPTGIPELLSDLNAKSVSLRGNNLGADLAPAIEENWYCEALNLFDNKLDDAAGVAIFGAIRRNVQLKHVSLAHNHLGEATAMAALETLGGGVCDDVGAYEAAVARLDALNKQRQKKKAKPLPQLAPLVDPPQPTAEKQKKTWALANERLMTVNLSSNKILDFQPLLGSLVKDIGCNTGKLTAELARRFAPRYCVGVDIDKQLVTRARGLAEKAAREHADAVVAAAKRARNAIEGVLGLPALPYPHNLWFQVEDVRNLRDHSFDVICAFSVTKWVHIAHGDDGLVSAFRAVFEALKPGGRFVFEPQMWSSYQKARSKEKSINLASLRIRPPDFPALLVDTIGFKRVDHLGTPDDPEIPPGFRRPIYSALK
ncbi:hypothetical protein CTAYLR_003455 [Chrysophaeum taylorii]|uniref:RNA methyltransferase n=1 Tax=Chrysophaeum taylorii TaxID=2483200 RepID=A0AAD7XG76_9STRA|nr:hypothetical protein CTAYLR_003455 [Chrysophaeum taylorii]